MFLGNISWKKAEALLKKENQIILVPLGSTEQHGPVGPLGTDYIIPAYFAGEIDKLTDVLITPTMPFGVATHHTSFPGTIDIEPEGLYTVMKSIAENLMKHGAKKFVFFNGHGGNTPTLERVGLEIFRAGGLASIIDWWSLAPELNPAWKGGHGDGQEVSAIMAIDEKLINMKDNMPLNVHNLSDSLPTAHFALVKFRGTNMKIVRDIKTTINHGGFGGSPSEAASKTLGEEMLKGVTDHVVAFIDEFRKIDLKKAHENA